MKKQIKQLAIMVYTKVGSEMEWVTVGFVRSEGEAKAANRVLAQKYGRLHVAYALPDAIENPVPFPCR